MFENEDDFKNIVDRLNIDTKPNPAHREKLRQRMLSMSIGSFTTRITIMKGPIPKLVAAAVIIIVAIGSIHKFVGSLDGTTAAFAQMKEAMQKMPWMHAISREYYKGTERINQHWQHFPSKKLFEITSDGSISHHDYGTGKKMYFYATEGTLTISDLKKGGFYGSGSPHNLIDAFVQYMVEENASIVQHPGKFNDLDVKVYEIEKIRPDDGMSIGSTVVAKIKYYLMADTKTKLMVAATVEYLDKSNNVISYTKTEVDYPETGPEDIYALGVPHTAKIIDKTLVAIDIKLPRPMFHGTPQPTRVSNLEKPLGRPRDPFLAPVGTKNVALGKPVSSSDEEPIIGEIKMITDGDKEATDGSYVELGPLLQHITIDLQAVYEIYAIVVWHYHKQARVYYDVVVQVADDPDFTTNVKTLFNNDIDNTSGLGVGQHKHYVETNEGKLIDAKGMRARYVRLYSKGNSSDDLNHYIEVEVYGKPVEQ